MSERACQWARALTTTPTGALLTGQEAHLLLLLASYHSEIVDSGYWPKLAEIAAALRLHERRTQTLLDQLEKKGCITRDRRGGRGHATEYTLHIEKGAVSDAQAHVKGAIAGMGAVQSTPIMEEKGAISDDAPRERVQSGDEKGAISDTKRVQSAVPDGEPKGGELPGEVTGSTSSPSLSDSSKTRAASRAKKPERSVEDITLDLIAEYADVFSAEQVRGIVGRALNHKASTKWLNLERGLRDWLRRDAEDKRGLLRASPPQRNGTGPPGPPAKPVTAVFVQRGVPVPTRQEKPP